ncbi:cytochrome d ubiquinol oxidase subunit II [Caballeronia novacaledonica]|uniref:cytochrome d ubiquinol oxidase subunit II n=1 Tax=Caballeronia novacaledonica TaxID=1544861 RepID=UPI001EE35F9E|nr:cytochrome d ubiquinol oxidase subunit II [Caballeronia novacaledonica]GJH13269.1 cytochrome d ubiquinol oxidase subunit II [Caballeronia novacaledonica]
MEVTVIWASIIALGLFMYVALDGFDLGIGMMFPFFPDESERDIMMDSIAPVWDGNETWLVLGGAALFAAFPMVYSVLLSALYLPIVFMLIALIFRGVSFELRGKANRTKNLWNLAFVFGSVGATFCQGVMLGAYLNGVSVTRGAFSGDPFFWVTPFGFFTGLGLIVTYMLQGATYLITRTGGALQERLYTLTWPLTLALIGFIAMLSIWTPLTHAQVRLRWFHYDIHYWLYSIPVLVILIGMLMHRSLARRSRFVPFILSLGLTLLGYVGLLVSIWPHAIPDTVTLWDAAAPRSSQIFTLVGAAITIPVIMAYTTAGYWVFSGKVQSDRNTNERSHL